jgi:pimeloyl-ACP methyl ester carboxylesterase
MLKQKLPSARVEVFEDAGHALFVDDAARFNALIAEFASVR